LATSCCNETERNQREISSEKKTDLEGTTLEHTGKRRDHGYQDVQVLGLAVRAGEVGQEVLGERCRHTNQTPRTDAPSENVLEPSEGKRRNGSRGVPPQQDDVPLSAAKSGFFIPAAVMGTAAAARDGGVGREERESVGEVLGRMAGSWGDKRSGFGGKTEGGVAGRAGWPGPKVGRDVVGLGLLEARVG